MENIKLLVDLATSIVKLIPEKPKTSLAILFSFVVSYVVIAPLIVSFLVPEKEISFRILDGDTNERTAVGNASVTLESNGKKGQSFPTNIQGRVTFKVKSSDICSKVVVAHQAYKEKVLESEPLIPNCYDIIATPEILITKKKVIPDPPPIVEEDDNHKKATFNFESLLTQYTWEFEKVNTLSNGVKGGILAEKEIIQELSHPVLNEDIKNSQAIIAVGLASCEGETKTENRRASLRAKVIKSALQKLDSKPRGETIYVLELGQYKTSDCNSTNTELQRRLLIIRVTRKDDVINLKQALRKVVDRDEIREWLLPYLLGKRKPSPLKGENIDASNYSSILNSTFNLGL
jgi:hypothetical protein